MLTVCSTLTEEQYDLAQQLAHVRTMLQSIALSAAVRVFSENFVLFILVLEYFTIKTLCMQGEIDGRANDQATNS